jgi:hypothetical protein
VLGAPALCPAATDNWQAIVLGAQPGSGTSSWAYAAHGSMQAGRYGTQAVFWEAGANRQALPSAGYIESEVRAMSSQGLFGTGIVAVGPGLRGRALLWPTHSSTPIELLPAAAIHSWAHGAAPNQLVGQVRFDPPIDQDRAALWHGPSHEFVDLHPTGASRSAAFATDGVMQGGEVILNSVGHAALWNSSASSWTSLNPPGSTNASIRGMAPGVQVGFARPPGGTNPHAALWRGTAASSINMNPTGSFGSEIAATTGQLHGGKAWFSSLPDALLWWGDEPDNYINLHSLLPPVFGASGVTDISVVGNTIYVTGHATGGGVHAVMWIGTIPSPSAGVVIVGGMLAMARRRR